MAPNATVTSTFSREPLETPADAPIVDLLTRKTAEVLGHPPELIGVPFWTDAALFAAAGIPTVVFGPGGEGAHADVEWVDLNDVERLVEILLATATRVLRVAMLPTPLERAPEVLCAFAGGNELWLKREDVHELGVFKWRSALPVVAELVAQGHKAVVTSSTGNHGAAVAWACKRARREGDRVRATGSQRAQARASREPRRRSARRRARSRRGQGRGASVRERGRLALLRRRRGAPPVRRVRSDRGRDRRPAARPLRQRSLRRSATGRSREESARRSEGWHQRPFGWEWSPSRCR